jgi:hypothetical protein
MTQNIEQTRSNGGKALGILLIVVGGVFLIGQTLRIDWGHIAWPFFVLAPGVALIALSLAADETAGEPLAMLGAVATVVGLILFYQNMTNRWESWAYMWALVAPTAFGLGQWLHGVTRRRDDKARSGRRVAGVGLVMFLIAAAFFELVIGIGGFGLGRWGWPVALIALGLALLARSFVSSGRSRTE